MYNLDIRSTAMKVYEFMHTFRTPSRLFGAVPSTLCRCQSRSRRLEDDSRRPNE
jgi:hypothetical protein